MLKLLYLAVTAATTPPASEPPAEPPAEDAPPPEKIELPPFTEAVARAHFYTQKTILPEIADATLLLNGYVLPPPLPVLQLFYAVASLCGLNPSLLCDACGELSWDHIKQV